MRPALARAILALKLTPENLLLYAWLTKDSNVERVPFGFFGIDMEIAAAELLWTNMDVEGTLIELREAGVLGYARATDLWYFV